MNRLLPLLLLSVVSVANASTPAEDFRDDKLLLQVSGEVLSMTLVQLDSFIEYVAICGASADAPDKEVLCEAARTRTRIKSSGATALKRIMSALYIHEKLTSLRFDKATGEERAQLAGFIERQVDVFRALETVAARRYSEINASGAKRNTEQPNAK